MGKRGPKSSSSVQNRIITGKDNPNEYLRPDRDLPKAAKAVWARTVHAMAPGFYTELDRGLLRVYSRLYVTYERALAMVDQEGEVIRVDGKPVSNPWFITMMKSAEFLTRLAVKIKACKSAVETHKAAAKASQVGRPEAKSARAGLMYGEAEAEEARLN